VNLKHLLTQPHIRAKILGTTLLVTSIILFLYQTELTIKLGFATLLIGLFMIVMITEHTIPQHLSIAQITGNLNAVQKITENLNLTGNAIFLPKNQLRTQERIFIPLNNQTTHLPQIDDDLVFATGADGTSLGIAIPPSGLPLLNELNTETNFDTTDFDTIEEKLQTFVGHDLIKSIKLTTQQNHHTLTLDTPLGATTNSTLAAQYPSPTTSAILTAITRAAKQPLKITNMTIQDTHHIYHFTLGE